MNVRYAWSLTMYVPATKSCGRSSRLSSRSGGTIDLTNHLAVLDRLKPRTRLDQQRGDQLCGGAGAARLLHHPLKCLEPLVVRDVAAEQPEPEVHRVLLTASHINSRQDQ